MWLLRRLLLVLAVSPVAACSSGGDAASTEASTEAGVPESVDTELVSDADAEVEPADDEPAQSSSTTTTTAPPVVPAIVGFNQSLGRGINLGNALDAPREGDWGLGLDESFFTAIADAGFDHVRLPVSWAGYAQSEPPFSITDGNDPTVTHPDYSNIWERVDWAIAQAERNHLMIVVNMHHDDSIHVDPLAARDRFLAMWAQIAERYADVGDHVAFELLNEPHQTFDVEPALWNQLAADALAVVRESNPTRAVLIGPVGYNSVDRLAELDLPDDQNLIATIHVYEPFPFTHQGAPWVDPVPATGTGWQPDAQTLPSGVVDYSWDTLLTPQGADLRVEYQRQFAGFSLDFQRGVSLTEVSFRSSGKTDLRVVCRLPDGGETEVAIVTTTSDTASYSFDLRACSNESTGIFLQNTTDNPEPLVFESLTICSDRGCEEMIQTASGALEALLERAAQWAERNDVPLHVGEFGAYGAAGNAPLADRAAWTSTVQNAALERGMSTAYWEFHSGFGAWDAQTGEWVEPIRSALLD